MENLHKQFVQLGRQRNKITYELLALLPEIEKQRIWEKEKFQSIFHYAKVLAGLSERLVRKGLNTVKKLNDKPHLQEVIRTEGVHKVALVASLATKENEEEMAEFVKNSSKRTVEEYAKEVRNSGEEKKCQAVQKITIDLDEEMQFLFLKLKQKYGDKISNKECMRRILRNATEPKKEKKKRKSKKSLPGEKSRYVNVEKQRELEARSQSRCEYPGRNKPATIKHHTKRWAENQTHEGLVHVCKEHHEFCHNGLVQNEQENPEQWVLEQHKLQPEDKGWRNYRQEALQITVKNL